MKLLVYVKDPVVFVPVLFGVLALVLWLLCGRQPKKTRAQNELEQLLDDDHDNCMY